MFSGYSGSAEGQQEPQILTNLFDLSRFSSSTNFEVDHKNNTITSRGAEWLRLGRVYDYFEPGHTYFVCFRSDGAGSKDVRMKLEDETESRPVNIYPNSNGLLFDVPVGMTNFYLRFPPSVTSSASDIIVLDVTPKDSGTVTSTNLLPSDLFDRYLYPSKDFQTFALQLEPNTDYVYSFSEDLSGGNKYCRLCVGAPYKVGTPAKTFLFSQTQTGVNEFRFRTTANGLIFFTLHPDGTNTRFFDLFPQSQINVGSKVLPYRPYEPSVAQSVYKSLAPALEVDMSDVLLIVGLVIGGVILLVLFWWGVRKIIRLAVNAFRRGRVSI